MPARQASVAVAVCLCAVSSAFQATTPPITCHTLSSAARRRPLPRPLTRISTAARLMPENIPSSSLPTEPAPPPSLQRHSRKPKLLRGIRKARRPAGIVALAVSLLATVGRLPALFAGLLISCAVLCAVSRSQGIRFFVILNHPDMVVQAWLASDS